jgi:hypothetical protein
LRRQITELCRGHEPYDGVCQQQKHARKAAESAKTRKEKHKSTKQLFFANLASSAALRACLLKVLQQSRHAPHLSLPQWVARGLTVPRPPGDAR